MLVEEHKESSNQLPRFIIAKILSDADQPGSTLFQGSESELSLDSIPKKAAERMYNDPVDTPGTGAGCLDHLVEDRPLSLKSAACLDILVDNFPALTLAVRPQLLTLIGNRQLLCCLFSR